MIGRLLQSRRREPLLDPSAAPDAGPWAEYRERWRERLLRTGPTERGLVERKLLELVLPPPPVDCELPPIEWCAGPRDLCERALSGVPARRAGNLSWRRLNSVGDICEWQRLHAALPESSGRVMFPQLLDPVSRDLRDTAFAHVRGELRGDCWDKLEDVVWEWQWYGDVTAGPAVLRVGWQVEWCPFWDYLDEHEGLMYAALLRPFLDFAAELPAWLVTHDRVLLCERPTLLRRDEQGRLHCEDGPAWAFADGTAVHAWHGTIVPAEIIERPVTTQRIQFERNAEFRRVLLERYGLERYLRERGGKPAAEDTYGRLWRIELGRDRFGIAEPLVLVEVKNATLEPDGSRRTYTLRVPPQTKTPREAIAWSFGLPKRRYRPRIET